MVNRTKRAFIIALMSTVMCPIASMSVLPVVNAAEASTIASTQEESVELSTASEEELAEPDTVSAEASTEESDSETTTSDAANNSPFENGKRRTSITPEEEAAGWQIVGGFAYSPEELKGQPGKGIIDASTLSGKNMGKAAFVVTPPSKVNEPCVVYFSNIDTYTEYYITLYSSADYASTINMPAGTYMLTGAGPLSDSVGAYTYDSDLNYFRIEEGKDTVIELNLMSQADKFHQRIQQTADKNNTVQSSDVAEGSTEASSETQAETGEMIQNQGYSRKKYALIAIALLGIAAVTTIITVIMSKIKE